MSGRGVCARWVGQLLVGHIVMLSWSSPPSAVGVLGLLLAAGWCSGLTVLVCASSLSWRSLLMLAGWRWLESLRGEAKRFPEGDGVCRL